MNGGGIFGSRDNRGNFTQLPTSPARTPNFHQGTSTHQISVGACPNLLFKQKPAARYNITTSSSDSYKDFITQNRSLTGTKDNKPWAGKDDLNQWGERALVARNGLSVNRTYSHTVSRLQPELASSKTPVSTWFLYACSMFRRTFLIQVLQDICGNGIIISHFSVLLET